MTIALHQRYRDDKEVWTSAGPYSSSFIPNNAARLMESTRHQYEDYLGRLVRGEPCGAIINNQESEPKNHPCGISLTRLSDQSSSEFQAEKKDVRHMAIS